MNTEYLVYRTGSNAANQPMTPEAVPIAIVRAGSPDAAEATTWGDRPVSVWMAPTLAAEVIAHAGNLDVWANQYLTAVPRSRARPADWNHVLEMQAMRDQEEQADAHPGD